jgi:hypothetical protein
MGAHTKGPWNVCAYGRFPGIDAADGTSIVVYGDGGDEYAGIRGTEPHEPADEVAANARLIASAPDLLEALTALYADYKELADSGDAGFWQLENRDVGKQALAALAKATGEAS